MIKNVKPEIAKTWLKNNEAILIDVRELSEHKAQSIKGSYLIPSGQFNADQIPKDSREKKIIIHCQRGGRAGRACTKLNKENPELDVYNLEGGILGWAELGHETIFANEKPAMSLERQVRLSAGLLILTGSILTILHPNFIALPALIGLGLSLSAIFNYCGMAKILAIMPWNK